MANYTAAMGGLAAGIPHTSKTAVIVSETRKWQMQHYVLSCIFNNNSTSSSCWTAQARFHFCMKTSCTDLDFILLAHIKSWSVNTIQTPCTCMIIFLTSKIKSLEWNIATWFLHQFRSKFELEIHVQYPFSCYNHQKIQSTDTLLAILLIYFSEQKDGNTYVLPCPDE